MKMITLRSNVLFVFEKWPEVLYCLIYNKRNYINISMRLLSHNLLICNVAKCQKNNFPLIIQVEKSVYRGSDFNRQNIKKLIKKLDWFALHKTVTDMGQTNFPKDLTPQYLQNEQNLKKLHRIILDTHIIQGKLICPNCKREYPIVNGIPNMILNENEI